jgi:hypothetical protein
VPHVFFKSLNLSVRGFQLGIVERTSGTMSLASLWTPSARFIFPAPRVTDQGLVDRHMNLRDEDYSPLEKVVRHAPNLHTITFKYSGKRVNTIEFGEDDGAATLLGDLLKLDGFRRGAQRSRGNQQRFED